MRVGGFCNLFGEREILFYDVVLGLSSWFIQTGWLSAVYRLFLRCFGLVCLITVGFVASLLRLTTLVVGSLSGVCKY